MTTDDSGQNHPSSLPVPQDGEQSQGALLGEPQGGEPELGAYGIPVQDRPVKDHAHLLITGCLIVAIIPTVLAIVEGIYHDVPPTLVWLGVIMGLLPGGVAAFTEKWHEKIQKKIEKKIQLGVVGRRMLIGALVVGFISAFVLMGIYDPNSLG
jgi:hypothetical protein